MNKRILLAFTIVSISILPTFAADESAGSANKPDSLKKEEISETKMKLSEEAFKLAGIDKEIKQITGKQLKMFYYAKRMSNKAVSATEEEKNKRNKVASALNEVFKNDIDLVDEMKPILIQCFAKVYTEDELKAMIAFYKSPTGQKMVAQSPKMTDIIYKRTLSDVAPKLDLALKAAIKEEVLDKKAAKE